jgi:hypothetical protein
VQVLVTTLLLLVLSGSACLLRTDALAGFDDEDEGFQRVSTPANR